MLWYLYYLDTCCSNICLRSFIMSMKWQVGKGEFYASLMMYFHFQGWTALMDCNDEYETYL